MTLLTALAEQSSHEYTPTPTLVFSIGERAGREAQSQGPSWLLQKPYAVTGLISLVSNVVMRVVSLYVGLPLFFVLYACRLALRED